MRVQVDAAAARDPRRAERLRERLDELDRDIRQGAKNLIRATDNLDLIQEELTRLRAERETVHREWEAGTREQGVSQEERVGRVDADVARLESLRTHLGEADPAKLRAVLGQLVSRLEVYWDAPRHTPGRKWSVFGKAVVKMRPLAEVSGSVTLGSTARRAGWATSR
jgi:hypothetical protein